jgi:hypothetical protein
MGGLPCLHVYTVLLKDRGSGSASIIVTLSVAHEPFFAQINRTALIIALEALFCRVQIFGGALAFAKYCQREWPNENFDSVAASIVRNRVFKYMMMSYLMELLVLRTVCSWRLACEVCSPA